MQRTRRLAARFSAAIGLLALPAALTGCVTPHLDGLATAECASHGDCSGELACIEGQCAVPDPMVDSAVEAGLDMAPDLAVDLGPDARPDVLDLDGPPDAQPDGPPDMALDMAPDVLLDVGDVAVDGPPDVLPDVLPDVRVDLAVDMEIDAGCVPAVESCNGIDDDCDERIDEVDGAADPLCPELDGVATQVCRDGLCAVETCAPGRFDVDEVLENGCECIAYTGFTDRELPEPLGLDADCDGVPGEADIAIYVAPGAEPGGAGTPEAPFSDPDEAFAVARDREQAALVFAPGDRQDYRFAQPLEIEPSKTVALIGGFVPGGDGELWTRVEADAPLVEVDLGQHRLAVQVAADSWFALDGVRMLAASTAAPIGVRAIDCRRIELVDSVLEVSGPAGAAARQGHDGRAGEPGADAPDTAVAGEAGGENGAPGALGFNPECAGAEGGDGGTGAVGAPAADEGDPAAGNAAGGAGANPDQPAEAGVDGDRGADGARGEPGDPAGRWDADAMRWTIHADRGPGDGQPGGGGGGGGAGFGADGLPGAGGGGGGAGGCAGIAGANGGGGAGSFGIVVVGAACIVSLERSEIDVSERDGGRGADGTAGGLGARGADGGAAGERGDALQPAAAGGRGGNGGCGGDGAGGPGGPSVGILRVGDVPVPEVDDASVITVAIPSPGGDGGSNPGCPRENADERAADGAVGISLAIGCCTPGEATCGEGLLCPEVVQ